MATTLRGGPTLPVPRVEGHGIEGLLQVGLDIAHPLQADAQPDQPVGNAGVAPRLRIQAAMVVLAGCVTMLRVSPILVQRATHCS